MNKKTTEKRNRRRGGAMIELALFAPWFFFLFVGALDLGFYCYSLISVENAARVAALYTSTSFATVADSDTACTYALAELKGLPNLGGVSSCGALPLKVTAQAQTASDGTSASQVSVTYRSVQLIPIPGLLQNQFTWTRSVVMRVRG